MFNFNICFIFYWFNIFINIAKGYSKPELSNSAILGLLQESRQLILPSVSSESLRNLATKKCVQTQEQKRIRALALAENDSNDSEFDAANDPNKNKLSENDEDDEKKTKKVI